MNKQELFTIMECLIDSKEVFGFLGKYPSFKIERPESGSQYVISKELGVDLMFIPDEGRLPGKTKHLRKCNSVFLYSQGKDKHEQYKGYIPLDFSLGDSREQLIEKHTPERAWKIGKGQVDLNFPNPSHDRWLFDNYYVSAHYSKKTGEVMYFIISTKIYIKNTA